MFASTDFGELERADGLQTVRARTGSCGLNLDMYVVDCSDDDNEVSKWLEVERTPKLVKLRTDML